MSYEIKYVTSIKSDLKKISKSDQKKIKEVIEKKLAVDPVRFGKPLQNSLKGHRRLRVGDYRVIYRIEDNKLVVLVIAIGHRRLVYK